MPIGTTPTPYPEHKYTACAYCAGIGVLEATDIFCGAGGSSLGLEYVCCPQCGRQLIRVTQCLNHWDLAVQAHNANFPDADHDVHDVEVIPAKRFRRTPILWASPDCTHHAYCRGPKSDSPEAQRSRATFSDIVRFTNYHKYDAVMVENVIEARLWCDEPGHKDKCNCGKTFDAWYRAMLDEGYEGQIVYLNAQFTLVPQSRDRMFIIFWRKGVPAPRLDFRPPSWCVSCESIVRGVQSWKKATKGSCRDQEGMFEWGRYGKQYLYLCPNDGCGQPVAPAVIGSKTIIDWNREMIRIGDRHKHGLPPLATNTRRRIKIGVENQQTPVAVQCGGHLFERKGSGYARVWSVDDPLKTVNGTSCMGLAVPGKKTTPPTSVNEPAGTITGRPHMGLILRVGGQNGHGRGTEEPTQTVIGTDRQVGLVVQNMAHNVGRDVQEPAPPVTGGGNHMLVRPDVGLVEFRNHGEVNSGELPAHTVTAKGKHHGLLVYNGNPGFVRDLADAAGTITSRDKQALLVPYNRTGKTRSIHEPAGTVTTKDREALIMTEEDIDDCLFRMLQWPELLKAQAMHVHPDGSEYRLEARRRNGRGKYVGLSNELCVEMIGNAVPSPVATLFGFAVMESLR